MRPRHRAIHRSIARIAVMSALALVAAIPLPAHAARLVVSEWGLWFFFAVAAGVVIVLLLYEVVEDDATRHQAPDRRPAHGDQRMRRRRRGMVL